MRSTIVILLALTAPAFAQTGNNNDLNAICAGVLQQAAGKVSGDPTKLCSCLMTQTLTQLNEAEMQAYAQASLENKAPPPAVMSKITGIANTCLRQAQ